MVYIPVIGFTLSQRESYAQSEVKLPPSHDITTHTPPLHIGVVESVQSADAEHVVSTAAAATTVLPVKRAVNDITAGSAAGAVDTHVPQYFPLETGFTRNMLIPMQRAEGRHNS